MKLGIIDRSVVEKKEGGYYIKDVMGMYLEKIAPSFSHIDLCAPVLPECPPDKSFSHYHLGLPNIRLCNLGLPKNGSSIASRLRYYAKVAQFFQAHVRGWDVLSIFLPGYTGVIASLIARALRKPYFVYLGTDWRHVSQFVWRWDGMKKRILFPLYLFLNGYFEKMVIKHSAFTLVHGDALQRRYEHLGSKIRQTAPLIGLSPADMYRKDPSLGSNRVTCLFVGALNPIKGLNHLIEALSILKDRGYTIALDLVGVGNAHYRRDLINLATTLNLNGNLTFRGYVPNGPALLEIYRRSDIFALPTLGEGFPRVLYEAMSQSLPIVTTNVGGIPGVMNHGVNALLVPPKNPLALADAMEQLITDKRLRGRLTRNGTKTVKEIFKRDTVKQLESLLVSFIPPYREWIEKDKNLSVQTRGQARKLHMEVQG